MQPHHRRVTVNSGVTHPTSVEYLNVPTGPQFKRSVRAPVKEYLTGYHRYRMTGENEITDYKSIQNSKPKRFLVANLVYNNNPLNGFRKYSDQGSATSLLNQNGHSILNPTVEF